MSNTITDKNINDLFAKALTKLEVKILNAYLYGDPKDAPFLECENFKNAIEVQKKALVLYEKCDDVKLKPYLYDEYKAAVQLCMNLCKM